MPPSEAAGQREWSNLPFAESIPVIQRMMDEDE
jgi:hypothetical protein